jgi:hypothetical protein
MFVGYLQNLGFSGMRIAVGGEEEEDVLHTEFLQMRRFSSRLACCSAETEEFSKFSDILTLSEGKRTVPR